MKLTVISRPVVTRTPIFALDRFSSQGIEAVFEYTAALDQCGFTFWKYCEPMLNTSDPMAALYETIIAWAAGYRNQCYSEDVWLSQARKRAQVEASDKQYQHGWRSINEAVVVQSA